MLKKLSSLIRKKNRRRDAENSPSYAEADSPEGKAEKHIVPLSIPSSVSGGDLEVPSPSGRVSSNHRKEIDAPGPSSPFLDDKPLPVELVRLPGEDPFEELLYSLKAAYNLIKAGRFDQAGMLYDIIDPAFKKYSDSFPPSLKGELRRYYEEVTLYLWIDEAYGLALRRRLSKLKSLVSMIRSLASSVLRSRPVNIAVFNTNMRKLDSALNVAGITGDN